DFRRGRSRRARLVHGGLHRHGGIRHQRRRPAGRLSSFRVSGTRSVAPAEGAFAMASTMKGPGIFLAQFAGDAAPFNSLPAIAKWAADLGYEGVQIPTWDARLFDLGKAATSTAY